MLGSGLVVSGAILGHNLGKVQKKVVSSTEKIPEELKKENKKLFKKLQRKAKKNNIEVITNPKQSEGLNKRIVKFDSGPYSLNKLGPYTAKEELEYGDLVDESKEYKKDIKKHKRVLDENPSMKQRVNNHNSILQRKLKRAKFKNKAEGFAVVPGGEGKKPLAADLAHELGHLDGEEGRSKIKANNLFHKNNKAVSKLNKHSKKISNTSSIVTGLLTGIRSGKKDEKNSDKMKDNITSTGAIIAASSAPHGIILGREYNASKSGIRKLKESGASKSYIKFTRKRLGRAYGTYALRTAPSILMGLGAREVGKAIGKKSKKNNDDR